MTSKLTREWLHNRIAEMESTRDDIPFGFDEDGNNELVAFKLALAAMGDELHTDDELSNLLWYSQEATCHSDPNYYCEFQRLATPGFIAWIIRELQERCKADSEPVATLDVQSGRPDGNKFALAYSSAAHKLPDDVYFLYLHAQPAPVVPDEMLCEFYEVDSWHDLVRELVKHVEQLQDSAKRNVKPWEDTFPETLLPVYIEKVKQTDEACRAAMLQVGNSPAQNQGWIPVSERLPETDGNYWGWWNESKRQGPVWFIKSEVQAQFQSYEITHWMPLPAAPQEVN